MASSNFDGAVDTNITAYDASWTLDGGTEPHLDGAGGLISDGTFASYGVSYTGGDPTRSKVFLGGIWNPGASCHLRVRCRVTSDTSHYETYINTSAWGAVDQFYVRRDEAATWYLTFTRTFDLTDAAAAVEIIHNVDNTISVVLTDDAGSETQSTVADGTPLTGGRPGFYVNPNGVAANLSAIAEWSDGGAASAAVTSDKAVYAPGESIVITANPAFDSAMTTLTLPSTGQVLTAEAGATGGSATFILGGWAQFSDTGTFSNVAPNLDLAATITDGTDSSTISIQIASADADGPDDFAYSAAVAPYPGDSIHPAATSVGDYVHARRESGHIPQINTSGVPSWDVGEGTTQLTVNVWDASASSWMEQDTYNFTAGADTTAPSFTAGPTAANVTDTSFDYQGTLSEQAAAVALVVTSTGAAQPSEGSFDASADTLSNVVNIDYAFTGRSPGEQLAVWARMTDASGNSGYQILDSVQLGSTADTTPNSYQVAALIGAEPGAQSASAAVTPDGYDSAASVSLSAGLAINIANTGVTTSPGTISPGQAFTLHATYQGAAGGAAESHTVTIGGVSAVWSLTPRAKKAVVLADVINNTDGSQFIGANKVAIVDPSNVTYLDITLDASGGGETPDLPQFGVGDAVVAIVRDDPVTIGYGAGAEVVEQV